METFILRVRPTKRKAKLQDLPSSSIMKTPRGKRRRYHEEYIRMGFTSMVVGDEERPQCVLCLKVLSSESLKPSKLRRHLESTHPEFKDKPVEFFQRQLINCGGGEGTATDLTKGASAPAPAPLNSTSKALLASFKVAYRLAQSKEPHTVAEELILPCAIDMVSAMFDEETANKFRDIPLSDATVSRRIHAIASDLQDQVNDLVRASGRFALLVDESTDNKKDCILTTYVRFIDAGDIKEDLLFCKQLKTPVSADDLFRVIATYLQEANLKWECCAGVWTDGARRGLQELIECVCPSIQWGYQDSAHSDWIRDPFNACPPADFSIAEHEQLIDVTSDTGLKLQFQTMSPSAFWIGVEKDYPLLGGKAVTTLLPFVTSRISEVGSSTVGHMKTKYRMKLNIESELRVAITKLTPRFDKLCSSMQAQPSH